jgi:hypothetical protein
MDTLSTFNNQFPYYELMFRGLLSAKTRENWMWRHTGWTLFYTSKSRIAVPAVQLYSELNLKEKMDTLGCLVGIGWLLPVTQNTEKQMRQLEKEFNNGGPIMIWPGYLRYEFKPFYRFMEPIPHAAPRGAVNTFKVPVSVVAKELERLGIKI